MKNIQNHNNAKQKNYSFKIEKLKSLIILNKKSKILKLNEKKITKKDINLFF